MLSNNLISVHHESYKVFFLFNPGKIGFNLYNQLLSYF